MTSGLFVVAGSFLASAVEMVEALTIVLALGITRGWRSALIGAGVALVALAIVVAAVGPLIDHIPFTALRVVIGGLLLIFGMGWLRKAILRASGYKALHDEEATYQEEIAAARAAGHEARAGLDWYAFTVSFKGVLLEGLEVAFIVLTFGASHGSIPLAAAGALAGAVTVGIAGAAVHAPLARVPENTMKFAVGITLTSFGLFWSGEGTGVEWPGGDAALAWIFPVVAAAALGLARLLRTRRASALVGGRQPSLGA